MTRRLAGRIADSKAQGRWSLLPENPSQCLQYFRRLQLELLGPNRGVRANLEDTVSHSNGLAVRGHFRTDRLLPVLRHLMGTQSRFHPQILEHLAQQRAHLGGLAPSTAPQGDSSARKIRPVGILGAKNVDF